MSNLVLPGGGGSLWIPGMGVVPTYLRDAMDAVQEYDPDLSLARNEQTGDWCIFLQRGSGEAPFPVFALGCDLPSPEAIKKKLYMGDVRRRGHKIVDDIERNNARRRAELTAVTDEAAGVAAETIEWAMRKMDVTSHKKVVLSERTKK